MLRATCSGLCLKNFGVRCTLVRSVDRPLTWAETSKNSVVVVMG